MVSSMVRWELREVLTYRPGFEVLLSYVHNSMVANMDGGNDSVVVS